MLDSFDKRLLDLIQTDCSRSLADLAEDVNLSRNAVWRRLTRLEAEGYVAERVARLDRDKLNLGLMVFIAIRAESHSAEWFEAFHAVVRKIPEVVGMYRMTGDVDYVLHALVPDMRAYDRLYKRLIAEVALSDVSSSFVMEEIKNTTRLPLTYA